jgi:ElaB/YqjD/DUF883 family membrane-anchored ribosome-binding protein
MNPFTQVVDDNFIFADYEGEPERPARMTAEIGAEAADRYLRSNVEFAATEKGSFLQRHSGTAIVLASAIGTFVGCLLARR